MLRGKTRLVLAFAATLLLAKVPVNAASTWTGGGTTASPNTGNWNTSGNWSPTGVPSSNASTDLIFGGSGSGAYTSTNNISGTFAFDDITLNSSSSNTGTIAGNALAASGNTITQSGSGAFFISNGITGNKTDITLTGNGSGVVTLNGVINGDTGHGVNVLAVNKTGSSTYVMGSSVTNTYFGATTITGGRFAVNGTLTNSAVTVGDNVNTNTGGLFGTGSIQTSVNIRKGGSISPGNVNSAGILKTADETWAGGGTYVWEMRDATAAAGTGFDQLQLSAALSITATTGNKFTIDVTSLDAGGANGDASNFNKLVNQSWIIATTTTSQASLNPSLFTITDHFTNDTTGINGAPNGAFSISGSGNNVVLHYSAAPEPGAIALLAFGITGYLTRRPRRR